MPELGKLWIIVAVIFCVIVFGVAYELYKRHHTLPEKTFVNIFSLPTQKAERA